MVTQFEAMFCAATPLYTDAVEFGSMEFVEASLAHYLLLLRSLLAQSLVIHSSSEAPTSYFQPTAILPLGRYVKTNAASVPEGKGGGIVEVYFMMLSETVSRSAERSLLSLPHILIRRMPKSLCKNQAISSKE
jgi:hypothetical protein